MNQATEHPISAAIGAVEAALSPVTDAPTWSMSCDDLAIDLARLSRVAARVAELELRLVAQAEHSGVAGDRGAASTYALWSTVTRQTRPVAKRRQHLAEALDGARSLTREAMTRGEVSESQAHVIASAVEALTELPREIGGRVDASVLERAEKDLIRLAADHDPRELRVLGKRILDVVAPELGEEAERIALEREEERAAEEARFTMSDDGHGKCHGRFAIPSLHGAMLRAMLRPSGTPPRATGRVARAGRSWRSSSGSRPTSCPRAAAWPRPWSSR